MVAKATPAAARVKDVVSGSAKGRLADQDGKQRSGNHNRKIDGRGHQHGDDQAGDHRTEVAGIDPAVQKIAAQPVSQQAAEHRGRADQQNAVAVIKTGHEIKRRQRDDDVPHDGPGGFRVPDIRHMVK